MAFQKNLQGGILVRKISICIVAILIIMVNTIVLANSNEIKVYLDNQEINFDQPPIIQNDRTLVPMRAIFEALNAYIEWNGETQTVKANQNANEIIIGIGNTSAYVNGKTVNLDVPATIVNNRTLVPLKFIAEALDCSVDWNGDTKSVYIVSNGDIAKSDSLYYEEFIGIPAPDADILEKYPPEQQLNGYYSYIYDYASDDFTQSIFDDYVETLIQHEFYLDEAYAEETDDIYFSYKDDQALINFSANDEITRVIVSVREDNNNTEPYYPENSNENNIFDNDLNSTGGTFTYNKLGDVYVYNIKFPLHLYGQDSQHTYLGELTTNKYDNDSISYKYGDYGSKYSQTSIFNPYSNFGSDYSQYSAFSKYASAPPIIVDNTGKFVAYLTASTSKTDGVTYEQLMTFLKNNRQ